MTMNNKFCKEIKRNLILREKLERVRENSYLLSSFLIFSFIMIVFLSIQPVSVKAASFVEEHGSLCVSGSSLIDEKGEIVQLRGVSTHGIAWFPQYVNKEAFQTMRDKWKVNTVRLALYTEEYNGYCTGDDANRQSLEQLIDDGVSYAKELGLYLIIDWHILSDGNPNTHLSEAKQFFKKLAKKYDGYKNIIYEICNEPNGETSWTEIKSYAKKIIKVIRANQKKEKSIIIIGTQNWSQDVDIAAQDPIEEDNIMYAMHFYAASHKSDYRKKLKTVIFSGLPVFVSEFGICDASGNGEVNKKEANAWKRLLVKNNISMCVWNLSNKEESSALLKPDCNKTFGWKKKDLSISGKWIVTLYQNMDKK